MIRNKDEAITDERRGEKKKKWEGENINLNDITLFHSKQ